MSALTILVVEKSGTVKQLAVKEFKEEELYRKCGFKSAEGFAERAVWSVAVANTTYTVGVWAKIKGQAGSENKHDFPPPIDSLLLYSSCALVSKDGTTNLSVALWDKIEERLFGGFHDLTTVSTESEDELAVVPAAQKSAGYLKDDFVVSDHESAPDSELGSELDYEEYDE